MGKRLLKIALYVSGFFGFISIAGLMRYLQTRSTFIFINYRMALGICVLTLSYYWNLR